MDQDPAPSLLSIDRPGRKRSPAGSRPRPSAGTAGPRAGAETRAPYVFGAAVLSGAAVSVAWWYPDTLASALLGWVAALLLAFAVRARRAYLPAYCAGLACCSMGFYWVFGTVSVFGGFGPFAAALVFLLFVGLSAVQFLVFAFIHHNLGHRFDAWALRCPTALVLSELISLRVFHWHFGHTQVAFTPFVQVAGLGGAMLVSFLMFWLAEVGVRVVVFRERRWSFAAPVVLFVASLGYGAATIRAFDRPGGEGLEVVLVQGNTPFAEHVDQATQGNLTRLCDMSKEAARPGALIVWPEGAIPAFIPADLGSVRERPYLPWLGDGSAFLVGSYAVDAADKRYNTAFAVCPDGSVPPPYFKQILIPFGEYMPLASVFPWIDALNAKAGVFSSGTSVKVFEIPMRRPDGTAYALKVAPLICYEDTAPALAAEATRRGAELLVNLTYDTWFGQSAAPFEHHLIATFRAIENRRYLVRATNSGFSAVVDPLGRTVAQIPAFTTGTVSTRVRLLGVRSEYTGFVRERPWWALLGVSLAAIVARRARAAGRGGAALA
jgi:apolipoprotein N-acyltransferase